MTRLHETSRPDLYSRVTHAVVADLENGVRPWTKAWSVEHLAGKINQPLRSTGEPYSGINIILLWPRRSLAATPRRSGSPSARRWRSAATFARASVARRSSTPTG
jgi:antirestriction protein ArdC